MLVSKPSNYDLHSLIRKVCDSYDPEYYDRFKNELLDLYSYFYDDYKIDLILVFSDILQRYVRGEFDE